ncbi:MAG: hypothetical protein JXB35_10410 [Anaerolineae bacterium]|nr:hypothetical protein [Anaerolineae bacterium]
MPTDQPGSGDVHVDALLTNMSVKYKNLIYIARSLAPMVLVKKRSDIVPKYDKSNWARDEAKETSEREPPPVIGYSVDTTDNYYCREYSVGHFVGDARKANTDAPFDADRDGMEFVVDKLEMRNERMFVSKFWKTGVWGSDEIGGTNFTKWSVYGSSNPVIDLRAAMRTVRRGLLGRNANVLTLGDLTFDIIADHPQLLERIKYSGSNDKPAMVTKAMIAALLGLERVEVGVSVYTASARGTAEGDVVYTPNWDDDALLMYVPPRPGLGVPAAAYTFVWQTAFGGPRFIKRRRDPLSDKGELIEGFEYFDQHVIAASAGVFFSDAVDAIEA